MRFEILQQAVRSTEVKSCPVGVENGIIRDDQLVASNYFASREMYNVVNGRLNKLADSDTAGGWIGDNFRGGNPPFWVQVNFDKFVTLTGVITQGRHEKNPRNPDQYVSSFKIGLGDSPTTVAFVKDADGNDIIFQGNTKSPTRTSDKNKEVTNYIPYTTRAKSIRIQVVSFEGQPTMRFEILQQCLRSTEVKSCPVGMENGKIRDNQLVASNYFAGKAIYNVNNGRLNKLPDSNGAGAWIGDHFNPPGNPPFWVQVNLDEFITFTGVVTQGRHEKGPKNPDQYVTSFKLGLGDSPTTVAFVKDANGNDIIFQGNTDRTTEVTNYIPYPTRAKSIRIHVVSFNSQPAMRFEILKQCDIR